MRIYVQRKAVRSIEVYVAVRCCPDSELKQRPHLFLGRKEKQPEVLSFASCFRLWNRDHRKTNEN